MTMRDLVIFGTGGFAREVLQIVLDQNDREPTWNLLGFLDDAEALHGTEIHDVPVLGGAAWLAERPGTHAVVAIGRTGTRREIVRRIDALAPETRYATLIHPLAWLGRRVAVGEGTIICAGTLITTDIEIGRHVILNLDCTVGHDTVVADYVTVAPSVNLSGNLRVGAGCDLGTGSTLIQGLSVGEGTVVGAGAVVVRDLPADVTAVGTPAKPIKTHEVGWSG